jgi:hypothetical protein
MNVGCYPSELFEPHTGCGCGALRRNHQIIRSRDEKDTCESLQQAEKPFSIVQEKVSQQFCSYREFSVVVDQSHCSEFVHEVRNPSPRRAHHFGQGLVAQYGDIGIRQEIISP